MDQRICTLIVAGEHAEALRLVAEAYSRPVGRFCAGVVGSTAVGEELMQEAFIEAWQAMPRVRGESTAKAWLFGIARRICIRHLRRRDRRAGLLERWLGTQAEPVADESSGRADDQALLRAGLAELSGPLRQAVLLRFQVGLDSVEMGAALGIRPATARKRVSLGIQALRQALRPRLMAPEAEGGSEAGQEDHHDNVEHLPAPASVDRKRS
jgi:RNA polymerase sigma-70 factor (ECF subfamily)